jgi:LysR family cys regulon transcriptional activator
LPAGRYPVYSVRAEPGNVPVKEREIIFAFREVNTVELIQLLSFHEIVKTESFSKASKKVFRSQSAVSHEIKNLEKELEVKLFERLGRGIKLTGQGKILFDFTNRVLNDLENVKRIYGDMQNGKVGNLTIASSSPIMTYVLPEIIKKFIKQCPGINFNLIVCSFMSEIQSLISEGEIDFGIGVKCDEVLPQNIRFLDWKSFSTFLIMSKDHPLSHKKSIKLSDIAQYPHIIYRKGSILRKLIEEVYNRNKIDYRIIMEVDVAENIKSYVEMGLGVGIISAVTLIPKDKSRFAIFDVTRLFGKVEIGVYYRKDRYISTATKQFIKLFAPELLTRIISPT